LALDGCQLLSLLPDVVYWHFTSFMALQHFRSLTVQSGHWPELGLERSVATDPTATLAVHCGNGFDASFSPIKVLA
jgi:hypothetical protein